MFLVVRERTEFFESDWFGCSDDVFSGVAFESADGVDYLVDFKGCLETSECAHADFADDCDAVVVEDVQEFFFDVLFDEDNVDGEDHGKDVDQIVQLFLPVFEE